VEDDTRVRWVFSIYYNGIFYAHCPLVYGFYVLDLDDNVIYNTNMKRV
jgi:hypothetical protein